MPTVLERLQQVGSGFLRTDRWQDIAVEYTELRDRDSIKVRVYHYRFPTEIRENIFSIDMPEEHIRQHVLEMCERVRRDTERRNTPQWEPTAMQDYLTNDTNWFLQNGPQLTARRPDTMMVPPELERTARAVAEQQREQRNTFAEHARRAQEALAARVFGGTGVVNNEWRTAPAPEPPRAETNGTHFDNIWIDEAASIPVRQPHRLTFSDTLAERFGRKE